MHHRVVLPSSVRRAVDGDPVSDGSPSCLPLPRASSRAGWGGGSWPRRSTRNTTRAWRPDLQRAAEGLTADHLRYVVAGPTVEPGFIDEARKRFTTESAHLEDRPAAPMRFLAEANLSVVIWREEQQFDPAEARAQLSNMRIVRSPIQHLIIIAFDASIS